MGYEVKRADIRKVRKATSKQIEAWLGKIQVTGEACNAMIQAPGMQGATAESIKNYVKEIHLSLLISVAQMIGEYKDRLYVYEAGYDTIDGAAKAHITQDSLEEQYSKLDREKEEFIEIAEQLQSALDEIADIFSASAPSTRNITTSFKTLKGQTKSLNETVGTYEEGHKNDCQGVREQISSIKAFIQSLNKSGQITISTYRVGSILENPEISSLQNAYMNSTAYYKGNGEAIQTARDYINTREELAEARVEKGAWDIAAAVGTVVIGAAAIVVTGGAAAPLVAVAIGSTIAYGVSNGIEAAQDIQYGLAGDIESVAINPVRDTVFLGNDSLYDTWGTISTGISLGFCIPGVAASAGNITIEGAKQGIQTFLSSGVTNIAKQSVTFGAKTLLVAGSGAAVEKVVAPYTSEDFGRLSGLLTGAYFGSKVFGVKTANTIEKEVKKASVDKFNAIRENWIDDAKADEFINTLDKYAQKSVDVGACKSKTDFYKMYSERSYTYSDEFIESIKKPYLDTGASSIVNERDIENAFSRFESIGRSEHGNFTTSLLEDSNLLYDTSRNLIDTTTIESIKGVDAGKYTTGVYQYSYDTELVNAIDDLNIIRVVDGETPGASAVNIPGGYTWAGDNIGYSESELIMPSIDVSGYDSFDVFASINNKGYFEISNPTIICSDGSKIQVNGTFKVEKIGE